MAKNAGYLLATPVRIADRPIVRAVLTWSGGCIRPIDQLGPERAELDDLIPDFIDSDIHPESSPLTPGEFARLAVHHGTVGCMCDPHEEACATLDSTAVDRLPSERGIGFLGEVVNVAAVKAFERGFDRFDELRCACLAPAKHYRLPIGQLRGGDPMNAVALVNVGTDPTVICPAINALIDSSGGFAVAGPDRHSVIDRPIAGRMNTADVDSVASQFAKVCAMARKLGCQLRAPFTSLLFLAIPVIPELRLGASGLWDEIRYGATDLLVHG